VVLENNMQVCQWSFVALMLQEIKHESDGTASVDGRQRKASIGAENIFFHGYI
jgi:hypothetical protein